MFDIAWSTIKNRKGGFIAAFIAVICGSAVITACGVLLMSGLLSGVAPERYAGATVMVGGQQTKDVSQNFDPHFPERVTVPASTAEQVSRVDGVEKVVRDRTVAMDLHKDDGSARGEPVRLDHPLYGHGWSSTALGPFELTEGSRPGSARETVLDAGLAREAGLKVGDTARLSVGTTPHVYRVVGLVDAPANGLDRQSAAFFTDAQATALSPRPDRLTAIGVLGEDGTDAGDLAGRIEDAVTGTDITTYTGDGIGDLEFLDVGASRGFLVPLSASFGGTALGVVIFVVSSTLGLVIHQRRRELAMLRAIAATPRQIHQLIGSEVLLVGVTGAVLGAAPGFLAAGLLRDAFAHVGVLPDDFELAFNPLPAVAAVLLTVLGARLAGFIAAFRIARIQPVEALSESEAEQEELGSTRKTVGVGLLLLGLVASIVLPLVIPGQVAIAGAGGSLVVLMVGSALISPVLVQAATRMLTPLFKRSRVSGFLAGANSSANARRLSSAVVPLALGTAMALMQLSMLNTVEATAEEQATTGVVSDYVLTSDTTGLSTDLTSKVRALDGVETVTPVARSQVLLNYIEIDKPASNPFSAQGLDARDLDRTLDLDVREGSMDKLRGDTVALSWIAADTARVDVGETADINLGDGVHKKLKVVAVYGNGLGFGDVTLPHRMLTEHTANQQDTALLVSAGSGGASPQVEAGLEKLAEGTPGLAVQSPQEFTAVQQGQFAQQSWTNLIANALLMLYVLIAVVNTLVMATTGRSREFAMLRLIGTSKRQTRRMMFLESWVVIVTAVVVGVAIAIPPAVGCALALTGQPIPYVQPLAWIGIIAFVTLLGWLSISLPTRSALRTRPIEAVYAGE
ncbi:ABC transporter permease [Streptomyces reniochalinae]|uniref:Lipoprotein ABC transporter permease n=1 Tax=Streptomyces reniochalinae TaxID=2250578 RepID=A0A367EF53_9ACTN|nr:FtsX-like permease family protein [Streptomyces reniochalinae]RCG16698.1 lipoprotein ABC transporter permease [Streptomyces reniochalinae]